MRSVRVVGHKRTYDNSTSLRGVTKSDFMIVYSKAQIKKIYAFGVFV